MNLINKFIRLFSRDAWWKKEVKCGHCGAITNIRDYDDVCEDPNDYICRWYVECGKCERQIPL